MKNNNLTLEEKKQLDVISIKIRDGEMAQV